MSAVEAHRSPETVSQALPPNPTATNRPGTYTCRCGAHWGGLATGHCAAEGCHLTFTGITAFDKHRSGSHAEGRFCVDPETVGLVDAGRSYPCWGFPGGDNHWAETAKRTDS